MSQSRTPEAKGNVIPESDPDRSVESVGEIATGGAAPNAKLSDLTVLPHDQEGILAVLSPEKKEKALALQEAMIEKFSTKDRELTVDDFKLVIMGDEGDKDIEVMVAMTSKNGLRRKSFYSIVRESAKNMYTIEVGGQEIDTREAMTAPAYFYMLKQAWKNRDKPAPDSGKNCTWITGTDDPTNARFGFRDGEGYSFGWAHHLDEHSDRRFRPAAVV